MTIAHLDSPNNTLDVAIVGGGITGLAAAAALPHECRWALFESHGTLGGKVATQHEHIAGIGNFLLEKGPDCLLTTQAASILSLFSELGLTDCLLPTTQSNLPVFVWHKNTAVALPQHMQFNIPTQWVALWRCPLLSLWGKMRLCMEPLLPKGSHDMQMHTGVSHNVASTKDESVGHFLQRRLGQQALDNLAEPLLGNIFQLHPNQQSLLATLPHVHRAFIEHGSLLLGMRAQQQNGKKGFVTLRNGMGSWIHTWAKALGAHRFHTNTCVESLQSIKSGGYTLQTNTGQRWRCGCVLLTIPGQRAAVILQQVAPQTAHCLQTLPTTSSASVYMAFADKDLNTPHGSRPAAVQGAGLLVPHGDARTINALTCVSRKFANRAPAGYTLLRAAVGGWRNPMLLQENNGRAICRQVLADLQRFVHTRAQPVLTRLFVWNNTIPQHPVGHPQRVQNMISHLPKGIFLAGSPYAGGSLPNCVTQGQQAARQMQEHLKTAA